MIHIIVMSSCKWCRRSLKFVPHLEAIHKRRKQSGEEILSSTDKGWEVLQSGRTHYLSQKKLDFSNFLVSPHGQGERVQAKADILSTRGTIFRDFVRTSFMDGFLQKNGADIWNKHGDLNWLYFWLPYDSCETRWLKIIFSWTDWENWLLILCQNEKLHHNAIKQRNCCWVLF